MIYLDNLVFDAISWQIFTEEILAFTYFWSMPSYLGPILVFSFSLMSNTNFWWVHSVNVRSCIFTIGQSWRPNIEKIVKTFGFGPIFQHSVDDRYLSIFIMEARFWYWIHNGKGNKETGIICSETRIPRGKFKILSWNDTIKKILEIGLYVLWFWGLNQQMIRGSNISWRCWATKNSPFCSS